MGLNMNHCLFLEGANKKFQIPSYQVVGGEETFYTESYMYNILCDFNQTIREAKYEFAHIYDTKEEALDEASIFQMISHFAKTIFDKIILAVKTIWKALAKIIEKASIMISDKISSIKDDIDRKYKNYEKITLLQKALKDTDIDESAKMVLIGDIKPTQDLLDKNFPNVEVIGGKLAPMVSDAVNNCIDNINDFKQDKVPEALLTDNQAMLSLADFVEEKASEIMLQVFGKYEYNPKSLMDSVATASMSAFGSNIKKPTPLTVELYGQAIDNLENKRDILDGIVALRKKVDDNYGNMIKGLERARKEVDAIDREAHRYTVDMNARYHKFSAQITNTINRILDVVQLAVNANYQFIVNKEKRAVDVFMVDAQKVKTACHNLIRNYLKVDTTPQEAKDFITFAMANESYNTDDDLCEEFDMAVAMMNEAYNESIYNDEFYKVLNEADGDQAGATATPATGTNAAPAAPAANQQPATGTNNPTASDLANKANGLMKDAGAAAKKLLDDMITRLGEVLQKFINKVQEIWKDTAVRKFWNAKREQARTADFGATTVNGWSVFDLERFKKEMFIPFDQADGKGALNDDEAFKKEIFTYIAGSEPTFANPDDSFSAKVGQCFVTQYIPKEKNEPWNVGIPNRDDVFNFVDEFITKGQGSTYLPAENEYKKLSAEKDKIKNSYVQKATEDAKEAAANPKPEEPVKQESAVEEGRFSLAEALGLNPGHSIYMSAIQEEVNVDQNAKAANNVAANGGEDAAASSANKEFDAKLRRYTMLSSQAITAKMTAVIKAYRQYYGFFMSVLGKPKEQSQAQQPTANQQPAAPAAENPAV